MSLVPAPPLHFIAFAIGLLLGAAQFATAAQTRSWTDAKGIRTEAEYISSTADTVMVRRPDGQALRLKISELSDVDRAFVAHKQIEEKEANMVRAVLKGEIMWRLPNYSSLGWSSSQPAEIWLWDDKTRQPIEKVASVNVTYINNQRNRNQFEGTFKTEKPLQIAKNARVIVKANFKISVNGKDRNLEELSVPVSLPPSNKDEINLPASRFSISR